MATSMTLTKFQIGISIQASSTWPVPNLLAGATASANRFSQLQQMAYALTAGTGSGQANATIFDIRQLAASASESLNFNDGSVLLVDGSATPLTSIRSLTIWQLANPDGTTAASSFTVGNAASNQLALNLGGVTQTWTGFKDAVPFMAGQPGGYTVDGTHNLLKVLNNDSSHKLTYLLFVEGLR